MTMKLKGCKRCGGDQWLDEDSDYRDRSETWYWCCLQCGNRVTIPSPKAKLKSLETPEEHNGLLTRSRFLRDHKATILSDWAWVMAFSMDVQVFLDKWGFTRQTWWARRTKWEKADARVAVTA